MCGICGFLGEPSDGDAARRALREMTDAIRHRGPDEEGFHIAPPVALGIRRLRIIDLATGSQPIANEDGSIIVVFNGEIYNHVDLRRDLQNRGHIFRTRCDTEVLVHLYEEEGTGLPARLNGMFAAALWDRPRQRLVLLRDQAGKKPLYYIERPGFFAFASEIKSLTRHPLVAGRLDLASLARYLVFEYLPRHRSILQDVRKLLPGHIGVHENGTWRTERYWDLPTTAEGAHPPIEEAAVRFRELFQAAVERRLVSDVPLGVFLSGGIDSTAVVDAMAQCRPAASIQTFSIGFREPSFDESSAARRVAAHYGTHHREEFLDATRMLEILPRVLGFLDEPLADASVLPTYLLSCFARQHVTVALGGDGGDEILCGYPTLQAEQVVQRLPAAARGLARAAGPLVRRLPVSHADMSLDFKAKQFLRGLAHADDFRHQAWLGSFLPEELETLLTPEVARGADLETIWEDIEKELPLGRPARLFDRINRFYFKFYLAEDILAKVDRASMATSLEVRTPFLDPHLVEYVASLPSSMKIRGWETKRLLRRALRSRLPSFVLRRPKKGFGIPVARWLRKELRPLMENLLAPRVLERQGIFQPAAVRRLIDDHLAFRRDLRKPLWTLLVFQAWWRRQEGLPPLP